MNVTRALYLLFVFGFLAIGVIGLRAEQFGAATRIERLQRERLELRRTAWALQMEIGRVRHPERIQERVARWSLDVLRPRPPSEVHARNSMVAQR